MPGKGEVGYEKRWVVSANLLEMAQKKEALAARC
jgi:hypothetical protein